MSKFSINAIGSIVHLKVTGTWGSRDMQEFINVATGVINSIEYPQWATISDLSNWDLATPEVEVLAESFQQWCIEKGQICEAIVGAKPMAAYQAELILKSALEKGLEVRYFDTIDQAEAWLNQRGLRQIA